MGYLVGDGSCKSTHNIILSCADPEIKSDQLHLLQTLTGSGQETEDKRSTSGLSMLRSFRIRARAFLDFAGVHYVGAADKEVPWSILASPKAVVSDFLRGYFEADGHVAKSGVEVTTKSDLLAKQIQILLLLFGVVARRSIKRHRKDGTYYRLAINAPFWDTFAREIGFVSSRKRAAMSRLVSPTKGTNVREIVPHQTAWVRRFYTKLPKAFRTATLGRFFGCQYGLWQCTTTQVHKIARQYGEFDPDGHFRSLENSGYFFDPVTRVQTGQSEVFDLTVPDGEMFVANGFMNHNTTLGRILARALLCETPTPEGDPCDHCQSCRSVLDLGTSVDFTEVDAATNSGKADIQKITEEIQYDTFSGRRRLYLFDEAHQLSKDALDAMLKPLEENVPGSADKKLVCIFCTTEPEKMRATIFSRCAPAFIIQPVPPDSVAQRLAMICDQEGVPYERPMLVALAEMTECHIRDALKAIEGLSMLGGVMRENVISYMHLDLNSTYLEILESLGKDIGHAIQLTKQILLKASPATCYEKLAELSLLAYQMQIGGATPPAYLDSNRVSALGQQHGDSLIGFASRLSSRPARPTSAMLLCDLAVLHHGGAAGSQPVLVVSSARSTAIPTTVEFPPTTISPPTPGTQAPTLGKMPQSGEPTLRPGSFNTGETIPVRANGNGSSMRYGKDLTPEDFSKLLGQALKEELSRVGSARLTDMGSS
jgi:DNA polymerase III subunit gamma/tau